MLNGILRRVCALLVAADLMVLPLDNFVVELFGPRKPGGPLGGGCKCRVNTLASDERSAWPTSKMQRLPAKPFYVIEPQFMHYFLGFVPTPFPFLGPCLNLVILSEYLNFLFHDERALYWASDATSGFKRLFVRLRAGLGDRTRSARPSRTGSGTSCW